MKIEEGIEKQYNEGIIKIHRVYDIFKDFFGEDKVDLQDVITLENAIKRIKVLNVEEITNMLDSGIPEELWDTYKGDTLEKLPEENLNYIFQHCNIVINYLFSDSRSGIPFILVWFPHVTVTNEHDKSTEIEDLYAKIPIEYNGTMYGKFKLNRASYTLQHLISDYMHSHICNIPVFDFSKFQMPCTGSGPINATISSLQRNFDEDLWNLFCLELSKYVTVESIAGTPYHLLEQLGTENMQETEECYYIQPTIPNTWFAVDNTSTKFLNATIMEKFLVYMINSKKIKFGYYEGAYVIGTSYAKTVAIISNLFIEWYNSEYNEHVKQGEEFPKYNTLLARGILQKCKFANNRLYTPRSAFSTSACESYVGEFVCKFKDKDITIQISDLPNLRINDTVILNLRIVSYIIWKILEILNYEYGNKDRERNRTKSSNEGEIIQGREFL